MSAEAELSGLHSTKSIRHLEQIAGLRGRGIGDYVDLLSHPLVGRKIQGFSPISLLRPAP